MRSAVGGWVDGWVVAVVAVLRPARALGRRAHPALRVLQVDRLGQRRFTGVLLHREEPQPRLVCLRDQPTHRPIVAEGLGDAELLRARGSMSVAPARFCRWSAACLLTMLLCPPHTHTSPNKTSRNAVDWAGVLRMPTSFSCPQLCMTVMAVPGLVGSDAGRPGKTSFHWPVAAQRTLALAPPVIVAWIWHAGVHVPNSVGASAWITIASEKRLLRAKPAAAAAGMVVLAARAKTNMTAERCGMISAGTMR
eukprot:COSAG01_NODE_10623_length_2119_cov_0.802475_3_plen_251_part_00